MANLDKTSVRDEVSRVKADFDKLCGEGKVSGEIKVIMSSLLLMVELLLSIFLERQTRKDNKKSMDRAASAFGQPIVDPVADKRR